jgi:3-hydroxyisobutyrate dehydrogenase-like beta-hydroxyacid dehydrogenase
MATSLGFIGLGTMGQAMAARLLAAGHPLSVWNRSPDAAAALVKAGAVQAASPAAVAAASEVVFSMVTDAEASEAVMFGASGIASGARQGLIVVDCASIAPDASQRLAERAAALGIAYLDAPVSGGPKVAAEGKLGIMVGGDVQAYEACRPLLAQLGVMVLHAGASGTGTTLKQICNLIMGVAIEACAEALVLAAKCGIDPQRVIEITSLPGTGPQTGAMATRGPRMVAHHFFPPHFSAANMDKDLTGALRLAEKHGVSLPAASASREILRAVKSQGNGHIDSSAVVQVLEAMAATSVKRA